MSYLKPKLFVPVGNTVLSYTQEAETRTLASLSRLKSKSGELVPLGSRAWQKCSKLLFKVRHLILSVHWLTLRTGKRRKVPTLEVLLNLHPTVSRQE